MRERGRTEEKEAGDDEADQATRADENTRGLISAGDETRLRGENILRRVDIDKQVGGAIDEARIGEQRSRAAFAGRRQAQQLIDREDGRRPMTGAGSRCDDPAARIFGGREQAREMIRRDKGHIGEAS